MWPADRPDVTTPRRAEVPTLNGPKPLLGDDEAASVAPSVTVQPSSLKSPTKWKY
jgi:hypothetical protein